MEKILKNKVIQSEEFTMKESRRYNVSVTINHPQDLEKMLWRNVKGEIINYITDKYSNLEQKEV